MVSGEGDVNTTCVWRGRRTDAKGRPAGSGGARAGVGPGPDRHGEAAVIPLAGSTTTHPAEERALRPQGNRLTIEELPK